MFKVGDFVIGVDQSYKRSIYEVVKYSKESPFDVIWVIFRSLENIKAKKEDMQTVLIRPAVNFRLATDEEVYREKLSFRDSWAILFLNRLKTGQVKAVDSQQTTGWTVEKKDNVNVVVIKTAPEVPEKRGWE